MAIGRRTIIPKVHEPNNVSITPAAASFAEQTPPAPHPEVDDAEAHNPASDAASAKEDDVLKMQEPSLQPAGDRGDEARENNAIEVPQPPGRHFMDVKNLREGDNGFGRRPVAPRPCDPLPEDTEKAEQLGENSDFTAPVCEITFFDRIQRIASPIVILLGAILGIYVFGNLASFWRQFCAFSWLEKICFGIPMAVFAGIVFYMLYRLVCLWIKLRTFTQISSKALHELQGRSELRELSRRRNQEARGKLEELLRTDTATQDDFIKKIAPKELENIQKTRETLLDDTHCSAKDWIDLYVKHYQSKLDEVAQKRISHYSWQAALAATTSPFPALDQLIVLATCVTLLKELFQIYNLKPKWDRNFLLMARIVIHVYVSGFWQQLAGTGADAVGQGIEGFIDSVKTTNAEGVITKGLGTLGSLAPGVGKFVAKGVTEFAMHKITVSRLGAAAIRVLQPVGK